MYYAAIILTVVSNVLYHLMQKITPQAANPLLALTVTYAVSMLVCLTLFFIIPHEKTVMASLHQVTWASVILAPAIVGLELGFLLAYRHGWNISIAVLVSTAAVAVLLLPIGLIFFRERLNIPNLAGFALCITGLALLNWK